MKPFAVRMTLCLEEPCTSFKSSEAQKYSGYLIMEVLEKSRRITLKELRGLIGAQTG